MLSTQMETVSIKQEGGDLSKLDYRARLSLSILLDQNEDWRRLCHLMNLAPLEGGFATFTSPTKDMLSMYEVRSSLIPIPSSGPSSPIPSSEMINPIPSSGPFPFHC